MWLNQYFYNILYFKMKNLLKSKENAGKCRKICYNKDKLFRKS